MGRLLCVEPTWKSDLAGGLLGGYSGAELGVAGEAGRRAPRFPSPRAILRIRSEKARASRGQRLLASKTSCQRPAEVVSPPLASGVIGNTPAPGSGSSRFGPSGATKQPVGERGKSGEEAERADRGSERARGAERTRGSGERADRQRGRGRRRGGRTGALAGPRCSGHAEWSRSLGFGGRTSRYPLK